MECSMPFTGSGSFLLAPLSWLLGSLDMLYPILFKLLFIGRSSRRPKFCRFGWGDLQVPYEAKETLFKELQNGDTSSLDLKGDAIHWDETQDFSVATVKKGKFASPASDILPKESKQCSFYLVEPSATSSSSSGGKKVYIVMLPATGEMGKRTRLSMALHLARYYGWSSLIITAPFYASRKPALQHSFQIDSIGDVLVQTHAIVQEATALARFFLAKSANTAKVCFTGFSRGGATSSYASALTLLSGVDGRRIACVSYVGCASPCCFADGILENDIDWDAFKFQETSYSIRRQTLFDELKKTHLVNFTEPLQLHDDMNKDGRNKIAIVRATYMRNDHFIQKKYSHEYLQTLQTSALRLSANSIVGGHIFSAVIRPFAHRNSIIAAVQELNNLD